MNAPSPSPSALQGKRGLVMGLANDKSIAAAVLHKLHGQGAKLVTQCLNEKALGYALPVAEPLGIPVVQCDVTQDGALEKRVAESLEHLGGFDFVVHSIAWAPLADLHGRVVDSSREGFAQAVTVSCHSFAELAKLCLPHFSPTGSLVTMTYHGADEVVPNYGLMGPVKAALESLVRYMAAELGPQGVRVHAVSPGPVPTRAASGIDQFDKLMEDVVQRAPLRRLVTKEEIAALTAFLCSSDSSGMTGQTIYVDGGYFMMA
ncbi:MAG: enoyl-ACP reductase FabI [Burkholderiaceae bacterium]